MHFAFTEDQTMLRDTVRDVLTRECQPTVVRTAWESGSGRAEKVWATLAENGFVGMTASEEAGGLGMTPLDLLMILEEAGYAALPEPLVETAAVGIPLLEAAGTNAQKEAWLSKAAEGEAIIAVCFEDQVVVPHAPIADVLLVAKDGGIYCVPRADAGLTEQVAVDRATRVATLGYEPDDAHLMLEGEAADAVMASALDAAAVASASVLVGLARRMLDMSVEYAKDRKQFGKPIGAQQAVQHHLANAAGKIAFAVPVVARAAWEISNQTEDASVSASMAKIYAAEAAEFVAKVALQVHGAIGYTIECDLHMWKKRVWTLAPLYGTVAEHRARVAEHVLG